MEKFRTKLLHRLQDFVVSLLSFKVAVFCVVTWLYKTTDKFETYVYAGIIMALLGIRAWKDEGGPPKDGAGDLPTTDGAEGLPDGSVK